MRRSGCLIVSLGALALAGCGGGGAATPGPLQLVGTAVLTDGSTTPAFLTVQPASSTGSRDLSGSMAIGDQRLSLTGAVGIDGAGTVALSGPTTSSSTPVQLNLGTGSATASLSIQVAGSPPIEAALGNSGPNSGGTTQFSGTTVATIQDYTLGKTEPIAYFVGFDTTVLSGCMLVYVNGVPTLSTISGTMTPKGVFQFTIAATNVSVSGAFTVNGFIDSANLTESNGDVATLSFVNGNTEPDVAK